MNHYVRGCGILGVIAVVAFFLWPPLSDLVDDRTTGDGDNPAAVLEVSELDRSAILEHGGQSDLVLELETRQEQGGFEAYRELEFEQDFFETYRELESSITPAVSHEQGSAPPKVPATTEVLAASHGTADWIQLTIVGAMIFGLAFAADRSPGTDPAYAEDDPED